MNRPGEAVVHYQRAAELQTQNPVEALLSMGEMATCKILTREFSRECNITLALCESAFLHPPIRLGGAGGGISRTSGLKEYRNQNYLLQCIPWVQVIFLGGSFFRLPLWIVLCVFVDCVCLCLLCMFLWIVYVLLYCVYLCVLCMPCCI